MNSKNQKATELAICMLGDRAKRIHDWTDVELGDSLGISIGMVRKARREKKMSNFPFYRVVRLAELAGYRVVLEEV